MKHPDNMPNMVPVYAVPSSTVSINGNRFKTPSKPTIHKWLRNDYAHTPDGCKVELDGRCHHGLYSWMIYLGLV